MPQVKTSSPRKSRGSRVARVATTTEKSAKATKKSTTPKKEFKAKTATVNSSKILGTSFFMKDDPVVSAGMRSALLFCLIGQMFAELIVDDEGSVSSSLTKPQLISALSGQFKKTQVEAGVKELESEGIVKVVGDTILVGEGEYSEEDSPVFQPYATHSLKDDFDFTPYLAQIESSSEEYAKVDKTKAKAIQKIADDCKAVIIDVAEKGKTTVPKLLNYFEYFYEIVYQEAYPHKLSKAHAGIVSDMRATYKDSEIVAMISMFIAYYQEYYKRGTPNPKNMSAKKEELYTDIKSVTDEEEGFA